MSIQPKRVAIVHDWLNGMRGGERTLEAILELFPRADIFTLLLDREKISDTIGQRKITTSLIQRLPLAQSKYRYLLPLFPKAVESFDLSGYDLVISTSHCVAKGACPPDGAMHVCYCFSPMRYVWVFQEEYFGRGPVRRMLLRPVLDWLKRWDRRTSQRVHHFVAISKTVAERIARFYGRDSTVIHPPVDTTFFTPGGEQQDFFLMVSALVPYKRADLAIRAFNELRLPLVVVGDGPDYPRLKAMAGGTVSFRGWVSDDEVREAYQGCHALVFPGVEDFGLTPVEAQACGKPVIAFGEGGVTESVREGVTGLFFREQTVDALVAAVRAFQTMPFEPARARQNSLRFSREVFKERLKDYILRRFT
ncbi:MAG: glycosyltransferase [bacterium]|nr:glycosyltransferase [bacterium]